MASSLVISLAEAQNWRCAYCGIAMVAGIEAAGGRDDRATRDHVVPKIAGGPDSWWNSIAACALCNHSRSAMKAEKYFRFVQRRGRLGAADYAKRLGRRLGRRLGMARRRTLVIRIYKMPSPSVVARGSWAAFEAALEAALVERNGAGNA